MGSHKPECVVNTCQENVKSSSPHNFCCCGANMCNVVQNQGVIVNYKTYDTAKSRPISNKRPNPPKRVSIKASASDIRKHLCENFIFILAGPQSRS